MANNAFKIVVDDGRRRVPIENQDGIEIGYFYFSPTDVGIIQRANDMRDEFESIVEPLDNIDIKVDGTTDESDEDKVNAIKEAENRLYDALNKVLNADVAGAFFHDIHPFSPVDGGFYCMRVINAIVDFINDAFEKENAKRIENVQKYTKKYSKK